jgi:hypothetical protein
VNTDSSFSSRRAEAPGAADFPNESKKPSPAGEIKMKTIAKRRPVPTNHSRQNGTTDDAFKEQLVATLEALNSGDFSVRLPLNWSGMDGTVAYGINSIAARLERFNSSLGRLRLHVGEEGKISERLTVGDAVGQWAERIEAINALLGEGA